MGHGHLLCAPDKGHLLAALHRAEKLLPEFLDDDEEWNSLDVNYEPPRVERLWREFEEGFRVCLHRIHPCEKALFHPHPWPSAIKIVSGLYEMGIGYGVGKEDPPEVATVVLAAGSYYEMVEPNGWHYVRPLAEPSLSVMVTGLPWDLRHPGEKNPDGKLGPLNDKDSDKLLDEFRKRYWK